MTAERIAQLEDIIGEAGACSDRDCSCKRAVRDAREELEEARLDAADSTEALYKEQYGPEYNRLATYQAEGR